MVLSFLFFIYLPKIFEICFQRLQLFAGILYGVEGPKLVIRACSLRYQETCLRCNHQFLCLDRKVDAILPHMLLHYLLHLCSRQGGNSSPVCPDSAGFPERSAGSSLAQRDKSLKHRLQCGQALLWLLAGQLCLHFAMGDALCLTVRILSYSASPLNRKTRAYVHEWVEPAAIPQSSANLAKISTQFRSSGDHPVRILSAGYINPH